MAKSKQKIKTKLAQKKASRENKRKTLLKKKRLQQPPQEKKLKYSAVKKSLNHLPEFVFEPELLAVTLDKDRFSAVLAEVEDEPSQMERLFTADVVVEIKAALNDMSKNRNISTNNQKLLAVNMVLRFIDSDEYPVYFNPLLIAKFYYEKWRVTGDGPEVKPDNIAALVREFENTWGDVLRAGSSDASPAGVSTSDDSEELFEQENVGQAHDVLITLKDESLRWIAERAEDGEATDHEADLEAFFEDFLPITSVKEFKDINKSVFNRFHVWFEQNLNPTPEDTQKMQQSLTLLLSFLEAEKDFEQVVLQDIRTSTAFGTVTSS